MANLTRQASQNSGEKGKFRVGCNFQKHCTDTSEEGGHEIYSKNI